MMEPVAWTTQSQLNLVKELPNDASGHMWGKRDVQEVRDFYEDQTIPEDIPLVRLSDAEARIKELEARNAELEAAKWQVRHVDTANDLVSMGMALDAAEARAEAAETLLKEAGDWWEYWDNGEKCAPHWVAAARAIHHKIGVKDE